MNANSNELTNHSLVGCDRAVNGLWFGLDIKGENARQSIIIFHNRFTQSKGRHKTLFITIGVSLLSNVFIFKGLVVGIEVVSQTLNANTPEV